MLLKVSETGTRTTSSGTSQAIAIPNDRSGAPAKVVRITVIGNDAVHAYVKPGASGVVAANTSLNVSGVNPVELDVRGQTHIGMIEGSTAAVVIITPLENVF